MRYFLLVFVLNLLNGFAYSQQTYTTVQSGNFTLASTWSLGSIPPRESTTTPPPPGNPCDCDIIISAGHTLTINANMTLTNANFVLDGTNSVLTFGNNIDLTMLGTNSSINVKSGARIQRANSQNNILLGGATIYDGGSTKVNSTTNGLVNGPASASAARAGGPQFINSTLPVKLSEFKVSEASGKVFLAWTTDQEINSEFYQIERSIDGKSFHAIAIVAASGNSNVQLKYSFIDETPIRGANYYRLKIVDLDAAFEYSTIKSISIAASNAALTAGPNPATSTLNIVLSQPSQKDFQLKLINRSGQVVYNGKYSAATTRISLQVNSFPEGSYFIEVTDGSGARSTKNVLILRGK